MEKIFLVVLMLSTPLIALNPPTQATLFEVTDTSMALKWQDNYGYELGYIIERDTGAGFDSVGWTGPGDNIMTYAGPGMSGLRPDKLYRYRAYCYDATDTAYVEDSMWTTKSSVVKSPYTYYGGIGDGSDMFSNVSLPLPPLIIKQATLGSVTDTSMILKWLDETGYELGFIVKRDSGTGYDSVGWLGPSSGIVAYSGPGMNGLRPDKQYRYRIIAYNASDTVFIEDSMWTTKSSVTKSTYTYYGGPGDGYDMFGNVLLPLPPLLISQATLAQVTDTSMVLKWLDQTGYENGYVITRYSGFGWIICGTPGPGSGIMTYDGPGMSGLEPDQLYRYRVWAYNTRDTVFLEDSMWTTKSPSCKAANSYYGGFGDGCDMAVWSIQTLVGVNDVLLKPASIPFRYALERSFPNPFSRGKLTIKYSLERPGRACLKIYNIIGQEIRTLVNDDKPAGLYVAAWDGRDKNGVKAASGLYIYRLTAGDFVDTKNMIVVK